VDLRKALRAGALAATMALTACGGSHTGSSLPPVTPDGSSRGVRDVLGGLGLRLSISLYDAPLAAYEDAHVNLAIAGFNAIKGKFVAPVVSYATPQVVDLLALQQQPMSVEGSVPAGQYDAVQLVVDLTQSNVTVEGRQLPLVVQGRKRLNTVAIDGHVKIDGGVGDTVSVALDFNVLESIKIEHGEAILNPKVLAVPGNRSSSMHGRVVNAHGQPVSNAAVQVIAENGTVANTSVTGKDGHFRVHAIPGGVYQVVVKNAYVTASGESLTANGADASVDPAIAIAVAPGDNFDLGDIAD
jgi:hypothetical protein